MIAMAKERRFIKTFSEGGGRMEVWVDTQTGVNYLFHNAGYAGGMTPLLDSEGKVVFTPIDKE